MQFKVTAIILSKRDIGGPDRIYTLYSEEKGKINVIGRGTRKSNAKLAGQLETLNLADVFIARHRGMGQITGAIAEEYFKNIKQSEKLLEAALEAVRIFDSLVKEEEKDAALFALLKSLLDILGELDKEDKVQTVKIGFLFKLLQFLGYQAHVQSCVSCGSPLNTEGNRFNIQKGGVECQRCTMRGMLPISAHLVKFLRLVYANDVNTFQKIRIGKKERVGLEKLFQTWMTWHHK